MKNAVITVSSIILAGLLFWLQMIEQPEPSPNGLNFQYWIYKNRLTIGIISVIVIAFLQLAILWINNSQKERKWVQSVLRYMLNQFFGGENYNTRITIMKSVKGYRLFFGYIYHAVFCSFFKNFHTHKWQILLRNIPIHFNSNYLIVYSRYSYPNENRIPLIYFRVTDEDNGVAVKCFREGATITVNTVYIGNISIPLNLDNATNNTKKKINKYMKDTYIDDINYPSLCLMKNLANNLWATPIMTEQQEPWGVFIIDNNKDEKVEFLKRDETDSVDSCIRLLQLTLTAKKR